MLISVAMNVHYYDKNVIIYVRKPEPKLNKSIPREMESQEHIHHHIRSTVIYFKSPLLLNRYLTYGWQLSNHCF